MESASVGATYSVHYDFSISDFSLRIVVSVFRLKSYKSIFENCYLLFVKLSKLKMSPHPSECLLSLVPIPSNVVTKASFTS